LAKIHQYWY